MTEITDNDHEITEIAETTGNDHEITEIAETTDNEHEITEIAETTGNEHEITEITPLVEEITESVVAIFRLIRGRLAAFIFRLFRLLRVRCSSLCNDFL